ncbi:hypothetical protein [Corynebacterium glaucum]|nr:hypothetical protein [Corynebacterium glaucum]
MSDIESRVSAVEDGADDLSNADEIHGERMVEAVEAFLREWRQSRRTLLKNVTLLGEASATIATAVEGHDEEIEGSLKEMANSIRPEAQG